MERNAGVFRSSLVPLYRPLLIDDVQIDFQMENSNAYKIGRGDIENNATYSITNGIIVDGQKKGDNEGWNP